MPKVKALYHFLDVKACRNRMQGNVFEASEERAKELEKAGLVAPLEPKPKGAAKEAQPAEKPKAPGPKKNPKE